MHEQEGCSIYCGLIVYKPHSNQTYTHIVSIFKVHNNMLTDNTQWIECTNDAPLTIKFNYVNDSSANIVCIAHNYPPIVLWLWENIFSQFDKQQHNTRTQPQWQCEGIRRHFSNSPITTINRCLMANNFPRTRNANGLNKTINNYRLINKSLKSGVTLKPNRVSVKLTLIEKCRNNRKENENQKSTIETERCAKSNGRRSERKKPHGKCTQNTPQILVFDSKLAEKSQLFWCCRKEVEANEANKKVQRKYPEYTMK